MARELPNYVAQRDARLRAISAEAERVAAEIRRDYVRPKGLRRYDATGSCSAGWRPTPRRRCSARTSSTRRRWPAAGHRYAATSTGRGPTAPTRRSARRSWPRSGPCWWTCKPA